MGCFELRMRNRVSGTTKPLARQLLARQKRGVAFLGSKASFVRLLDKICDGRGLGRLAAGINFCTFTQILWMKSSL